MLDNTLDKHLAAHIKMIHFPLYQTYIPTVINVCESHTQSDIA